MVGVEKGTGTGRTKVVKPNRYIVSGLFRVYLLYYIMYNVENISNQKIQYNYLVTEFN